MLRKVLMCVAFVAPIWAAQQGHASEDAEHCEIRGRVVEFGGSQGVYDAKVTLERYEGAAVSSFVERRRVGVTTTDAGGSFVFRLTNPGTYRVTVTKDGYGSPGGVFNRANWTSTDITLDANRTVGEVRFVLARPAEIEGCVVDGDTQSPVAGVRVAVWQYAYVRGNVRFMPGGEATTDKDGQFHVANLPPTDYVIGVEPRIRDEASLKKNTALQGENRMLTEFAESDFKTVDHDYSLTYWPGGVNATDAFPVVLASGAKLDMGVLTIYKTPKYRVRVTFAGESCQPGERRLMYVTTPSSPVAQGVGVAQCGKEVLLRGFAPGSYQLEVGEGSSTRGWAPFTITDENLAVPVDLSHGLELDGKVVMPEGAAMPDLRKVRIVLFPSNRPVQNAPVTPDASGHFRIPHVLVRNFDVSVRGIPENCYVKEIHYNGRRLSEGTLSMDSYAHAQSMDIILGEKAATVTGTIADDDKPVPNAYAVMIRTPVTEHSLFASITEMKSDEDGRFRFAGLAPGDYRLLAVAADDRPGLDRPNTLSRLIESADKISLREAQSQTVQLKLTRP